MDARAILFVPLMAAAWMLGTVVAALASHYFLTIVESSATAYVRNLPWKGRPFREWICDGVNWPDDLFIDYFAKMFYFAYIIGIWAGPACVFGRLVAGSSPWATLITGTAFWFFFPIGLLSSLASQSRWTPFWSGVIVAFYCRPAKTFFFYLLSAPVVAIVFLTFDLILIHSSKASVVWAIGLSPIAVLAFFIYARLIGRLGLIVSFTRPEQEKSATKPKKRKKPKKLLHAYDPVARQFGPKEEIQDDPPSFAQPSDLGSIQTPDGEVTGYGVDYDGTRAIPEEVKPARIIHTFDDEDQTPITVAPLVETAGTDRERIAAEMAKPSERELSLYLRERPTEPRNPFGAESILFLFDLKTIAPWLTLTLGLILMALIQRGLDGLRPE